MVPSTPNPKTAPHAVPSSEDVLEEQLRDIFARTAYSHKAHEKAAEQCTTAYRWLNNVQIVLSALASGSLLIAVFGDSRPSTIIGAILSTAVLALSALIKDNDFSGMAERHASTAQMLWSVREDYLSLLTDLRGKLADTPQLLMRRDLLKQRLDQIFSSAPKTTHRAFKAAQKALKAQEELTFNDGEIDAFLPQALRK